MNSTASKSAAANPKFIVAWHYAVDGEIIGFQRCQFRTKKAAIRTRDGIASAHPTWNVVLGSI